MRVKPAGGAATETLDAAGLRSRRRRRRLSLPYIPHTSEDVRAMLDRIGVGSIDDLFDEIPEALRIDALPGVPEALPEMDVARLAGARAAADGLPLNFIGAGAYEHHIPAPVWALVTRGEIYSAYTPYQAEASQGTLQIMYEYQSMIAGLTAMDVSNASLYDGASALAEACLMAVRAHRRSKSARILVPATVNPTWRRVARRSTEGQGLKLEAVPYDPRRARRSRSRSRRSPARTSPRSSSSSRISSAQLEDVDALTRWARANGALVIAAVNPVALALLAAAGRVGRRRRRHRRAAMPSPAACRCPRAALTSASWPAGWNTCARCPGASRAAPWIPRASPASR